MLLGQRISKKKYGQRALPALERRSAGGEITVCNQLSGVRQQSFPRG